MTTGRWSRPRVRLVAAAAALAAVLAGVGGCAGGGGAPVVVEASPQSPFQLCPSTSGPAPTPAGEPLPTLTLPCFTGGAPVAIAALGKPAIINLWKSSCGPCRQEMPAIQQFADELGDSVVVLGVVTGDRWSAAAYAGEGFGVSYPSVFDVDEKLRKALGRNALPVTLFVAADGTVVATDMSGALTLDKLRALARQHLGVGR